MFNYSKYSSGGGDGAYTFDFEKYLYPDSNPVSNPFNDPIGSGLTDSLPGWANRPTFGLDSGKTKTSTPSGIEGMSDKINEEVAQEEANDQELKQEIYAKIQNNDKAFNALMNYADKGQGADVLDTFTNVAKDAGGKTMTGAQYGDILTSFNYEKYGKKDEEAPKETLDLGLKMDTKTANSTSSTEYENMKSTWDFFPSEFGNAVSDYVKDVAGSVEDTMVFWGKLVEAGSGGYRPSSNEPAAWDEKNFLEKTQAVMAEAGGQLWQAPITVGTTLMGLGENSLRALEWQGLNATKGIADKLEMWQNTASQYVDENAFQKVVGASTSAAAFYIPAAGTAKAVTMFGKFSPRIASLAGGSVMTLFESALEAGDVYHKMKQQGANHQTASSFADFTFFGNTALLGATNALGVFNPAISRGLIKTMVSSGLEGIQEMGQTMMSNVATGRPMSQGAFESMALGAIMGGFMGSHQAAQEGADIMGELSEMGTLLKDQSGFAKIPDVQKLKDIINLNKRRGLDTSEMEQEVERIENGVSYGFVSPQVKTGGNFEDANRWLGQEQHKKMTRTFNAIDEVDGFKDRITTKDAIGDWSDGAENTTYFYGDLTLEEMKYNVARKSTAARQKQGIYFTPNEKGESELFRIAHEGKSAKEVKDAMEKAGIMFKTLGNGESYIFNASGDYFDGSMKMKINDVMKELGLDKSDLFVYNGDGELIGSWLEEGEVTETGEKVTDEMIREDAIKTYKQIIQNYENKTNANKEILKQGDEGSGGTVPDSQGEREAESDGLLGGDGEQAGLQDKIDQREKVKTKPAKEKYYEDNELVTIYRVNDNNIVEKRTVQGKELSNYTRQGDWSTDRPKNPPSVDKIMGEKPSPYIRKRETTLLKDKIRNLARGNREGRQYSKKEIKANQTEILKLLKDSELSAKDKAKFIPAIKNVQTNEQLEKALPKILERIDALEETMKKKVATKAIAKTFKQIKPVMQSGKKVGKMSPTIQTRMEKIKDIIKMDVGMTEARIGEILSNVQSPLDLRAEDALELELLQTFGGLETKTGDQLLTMAAELKKMKDLGTILKSLKVGNQIEEFEANVAKGLEEITGGKEMPAGTAEGKREAVKGSFKDKVKRFVATKVVFPTNMGWDNLLGIVTRNSETKAGESFIEKQFDVIEQINKEKKGQREMIDNLKDSVKKALGVKKDRQLVKRLVEMNKEAINREFINANGDKYTMKMTRAEVIKRYMEFQDESLNDTWDEQGWTEEMKEAIVSEMTGEDLEFADAAFKFWEQYHDRINPIYEEMYNMSLEKRDNYSPIVRKKTGKQGTDITAGEFMEALTFMKSVAGNSLKSRKAGATGEIQEQSVLLAMEKHIALMEHFIAWAPKIREMNYFFRNSEVAQAIKLHHGDKVYNQVIKYLDDFTMGGIELSDRLDVIDKLRVNLTKATLGAKPSIGVKQLTSVFAFADDVPATAFVSGVADFFTNPVKNWKTLKEKSTLFKERGQSMERDIQTAMRSDEYNMWRKNQSFSNTMMLNVQMGDQLAIAVGGWAVYKHALKQGKTEAEAIRAFEKSTQAAQQSSDISQQSYWQRASSVTKLFTMYMSTPNQYYRKEVMATTNALHGRVSVKDAAKTIAIYHFILPQIFQAVADLGWDEDKQKRAAILGSFNGVFIAGDILEGLITNIINLTKDVGEYKMKEYGNELPIYGYYDKTKKIIKEISKMKDGDISFEQVMEAIKKLAGAASVATGIPMETIIDVPDRTVKALKDPEKDFYEKLYTMLGFSEWTIDQRNERLKRADNEEYRTISSQVTETRKRMREEFQPRYDELRQLRETDEEEFKRQLDDLAENEPGNYEIYKDIKANEKRAETIGAKPGFYENVYKKARSLQGDERKQFIDSLSDEEYEDYKKMRDSLEMTDYMEGRSDEDVKGYVPQPPAEKETLWERIFGVKEAGAAGLDSTYTPSPGRYMDETGFLKAPVGVPAKNKIVPNSMPKEAVDNAIEDYITRINVTVNTGAGAKNNNPGNLEYHEQPNSTKNGRWANFTTPELGLRALLKQIQADIGRNDTIESFVRGYAPPVENNVVRYIDVLTSGLGVNKNTPLGDVDIFELAKLIAEHESGTVVED